MKDLREDITEVETASDAYSHIFATTKYPSAIFEMPGWSYCGIPYGSSMSQAFFLAIAAGARMCGDSKMWLLETASYRPEAMLASGDFQYDQFNEFIYKDAFLASTQIAIFGESQRWGCLLHASDVGFFGGDELAINAFVSVFASVAKLREINDEYFSPDRGDWPPELQKLINERLA
jgi:hypothetical protein